MADQIDKLSEVATKDWQPLVKAPCGHIAGGEEVKEGKCPMCQFRALGKEG